MRGSVFIVERGRHEKTKKKNAATADTESTQGRKGRLEEERREGETYK